jgi:hypothetical protein
MRDYLRLVANWVSSNKCIVKWDMVCPLKDLRGLDILNLDKFTMVMRTLSPLATKTLLFATSFVLVIVGCKQKFCVLSWPFWS